MKSHLVYPLISCLILITTGLRTQAQMVFSASDGFSLSNNPTGVWSYGIFAPGGINPATFSLNMYPHVDQSIEFFSFSSSLPSPGNNSHPPYVARNPSSNPATYIPGPNTNGILYQPNQLCLHPGQGGEYSVLRFSPGFAGEFNISSTFNAIDMDAGTTTDVHIWKNNSSLFAGNINPGSSLMYSTGAPIHLDSSDSLYWIVGYGANGTWWNDSTGLFATVTAVPEPSGLCLFSGVLFGALLKARRHVRCFGGATTSC